MFKKIGINWITDDVDRDLISNTRWNIETNHTHDCNMLCDKELILSHIDELADMISMFGIEHGLRDPNSVLSDKDRMIKSIRYFINNPEFLFKSKNISSSFQNRVLSLFNNYKGDSTHIIKIKKTLGYLLSWAEEHDRAKIDFLPYITYICDIKWNRPDLKEIVVGKSLDIILWDKL